MARTTDGNASSSWPTTTTVRYGSNQGGAAGRVGKIRYSLEALAKQWPTTTTTGDAKGRAYHYDNHDKTKPRAGLLSVAYDVANGRPPRTILPLGADTQSNGRILNPQFCEALMGFPLGWTIGLIASERSEVLSSPSRPPTRLPICFKETVFKMSNLPNLPPLPPLGGVSLPALPTLPPLGTFPPLPERPALDPVAEAKRIMEHYAPTPARILLADPPWQFGDKLPGPKRGAEKHYGVLDLDGIKNFPLPPLEENAVLFMWRVSAMVEEAYQVVRAWGFIPKSEISWRKTRPCSKCSAGNRSICEHCKGRGFVVAVGMGRYTRHATETCIIAVRGKLSECKPVAHDVLDTFDAHRLEHSEKPDKFYEIIEKLYPRGPYVELFARRRRDGWLQYGDQLATTPPL